MEYCMKTELNHTWALYDTEIIQRCTACIKQPCKVATLANTKAYFIGFGEHNARSWMIAKPRHERCYISLAKPEVNIVPAGNERALE
jgi:hypothetical protein